MTDKNLDELRESLRRDSYRPVADIAGCTIDAAMLAYDAVQHAADKLDFQFGESSTGAVAEDVCNAFRDICIEYFSDRAEALELLAEWGIRGSEDLGRIVHAILDVGWLGGKARRSDDDDFKGHFTLESLFPSGFK